MRASLPPGLARTLSDEHFYLLLPGRVSDFAKEHDHPSRVMYAPLLAGRIVVLEDTPEILCICHFQR